MDKSSGVSKCKFIENNFKFVVKEEDLDKSLDILIE